MNKVYVGKIVNTFGIKGELKIVSRFEMANRVFIKDNILLINDDEYVISNVRFHKNNYLVEVNNIKDINKVEYLINSDVYFDYDNLKLKEKEYLISELVDYKVVSCGEIIGIVTSYDDNKLNPLIKVNDKTYIPLRGFYEDIDKYNKIIYVKDLSGLL